MTHNKEYPSTFASTFDDILFEDEVLSLAPPEHTGDWTFYDYQLTEIDSQRHIVPMEKKRPRRKPPTRQAELNFHNYDLVCDTISLVVDPGRDGWRWDSLDAIVPPPAVLDWCRHWGLPADVLWDKYQTSGYPVADLQKHAATLYLIYQLHYFGLAEDSSQMCLHYSRLLVHPDFERRPPDYVASRLARFKAQSAHDQRQSADFVADMVIDHEIQALRLCFSSRHAFRLQAHSLIPMCYYQLGILKAKGEGAEGIRRIRQCKHCHSLFWGHGNRRHCHKCDRRVIYVREARRKNKDKGGQ